MESSLDTGGSSWSSWFQQAAGGLIDKAGTAAFVKPYDVKELELSALGQGGYYREGQAGARPAAAPAGFAITPTMMLIGAAAVAALFLLRK